MPGCHISRTLSAQSVTDYYRLLYFALPFSQELKPFLGRVEAEFFIGRRIHNLIAHVLAIGLNDEGVILALYLPVFSAWQLLSYVLLGNENTQA